MRWVGMVSSSTICTLLTLLSAVLGVQLYLVSRQRKELFAQIMDQPTISQPVPNFSITDEEDEDQPELEEDDYGFENPNFGGSHIHGFVHVPI